MPDKKVELARLIKKRIAHDKLWGAANFGAAYAIVWITTLASFGAVISAAVKGPAILTVALTTISGSIIVLGRNQNFMSLSRWHHKLAARLQAIERSMEFENKPIEAASAEYSKTMIEFEDKSPIIIIGGLLEQNSKDVKKSASL
jgi:hypothetical protein